MMRSISDIFKYEEVDSIMHRLDPRGKLITAMFYLIATIIFSNIDSLLILFIPIVIQLMLGKTLKKAGRGFLALSPFLILIFILNYLALGNMFTSLIPVIRFILFLIIMNIFFLTTDPDDFALTLEALSLPLVISLSFTLALRFIPTVAQQVNEIIEAQLSRGLRLDQGNFLRRLRNYLPILIPVIILSIKRSIEVAESLEIRGVDPEVKRTSYTFLKFTKKDIAYIIINLLVIVSIYFIVNLYIIFL